MDENVVRCAWCNEEFRELGCRGHIHRERVSHIRHNVRSRCGGRNGRGASRAWDEGMFEGSFDRMELGDVLLELGALVTVFDEEASIRLVCDLHLLNHNLMFNFEHCDLVRDCVIRGRCISVRWCCAVRRMYSAESLAWACVASSWSCRHVA